jgi:hypothetical protein
MMALCYPLMLGAAVIYALYARVCKGTAADILKSSLAASFKAGASYVSSLQSGWCYPRGRFLPFTTGHRILYDIVHVY